ncbi:MAG: UDP-N-acetylmuramoyl-tripeptide--D-alanyl-D-alanine ligase [Paludibacteraceae bacterium]|nr:UDP-N-acetylmuramoyl-tripeptide--D-alanyl-D-alanine ligase [Paludibacteraceae bacterium]
MEIETLYQLYESCPTVTTDSRVTPAGSMFFALKGENFDGNQFAKKALEGGCGHAVIDDASQDTGDGRCIVVEDVLTTLQELAKYHRIALGLPVICVTGTNGKTTTKELMAAVLSKRYDVAYTQGNHNNHIGVPLTLLSIGKEKQIAIVETGANHPGEIKTLVEIAVPNAGLITNVGKAHLEGFGSFEGVVKTKCEMYDFLKATGGMAFVNMDNEILREKSEDLAREGYGLKEKGGNVSGEVTSCSPFLNVRLTIRGHAYDVSTHLIGGYNAENVVAAACVGTYFGVSGEDIKAALEAYEPTNNRSQFTKTDRNALIVDAYNANPTSMTAAVENFSKVEMANKSLILGEMRELGSESEKEHKKLVALLKEKGFEDVYLVGKCFDGIAGGFRHFETTEALKEYLKREKIAGRTILIKGSNGNHLSEAVELL